MTVQLCTCGSSILYDDCMGESALVTQPGACLWLAIVPTQHVQSTPFEGPGCHLQSALLYNMYIAQFKLSFSVIIGLHA